MTGIQAKQAGRQGQKQAGLGQKQSFWRNLTVVPTNLGNPDLWYKHRSRHQIVVLLSLLSVTLMMNSLATSGIAAAAKEKWSRVFVNILQINYSKVLNF